MTESRHAVSLDDATERIRADHALILGRVEGRSGDDLAAPYRGTTGSLGDFCESLHDLVAHVLMWDEINLAVLTEAAAGRAHWSLQPRWETPDAGRQLNHGGVAAGRHVASALLLDRLRTVRDALLDQFGRYNEQVWVRAGRDPLLAGGLGALAQRVWTVPGQPAFWHAAIHLNQLPGLTHRSGPADPPG